MDFNPFLQAKWIFASGYDPKKCQNCYFDYLSDFTAEKSGKVTLYLSVYSAYAVYINGSFVNCGQMADYEHHQIYEELDITDFVISGKNTLHIAQYAAGINTSTVRVQKAGVIFSVFEGEKSLLISDESCLSRKNNGYLEACELISAQLNFNFDYDATAAEFSFKNSIPVSKKKALFKRNIKKPVISETLKGKPVKYGVFYENGGSNKAQRIQNAVLKESESGIFTDGTSLKWSISSDADGVFAIFDLMGECAGLFELFASLPYGTEVLIGYGEHIADGRVRASLGGRSFALRYTAKEGKNSFLHPFLRLGGRYIELHIYSKKGEICHTGVKRTDYPLNHLTPTVSSKLHLDIWNTAAKTLGLCMHEHYEDCPWREQAMYGMDSRIQILCGYYAFGESDFPREALEMMSYSLREDGTLELCPPGIVPITIPSFTAIYLREVWEYTLYCKDNSLAATIFDSLKAIADGFIGRIDETGLIPLYRGKKYWNFYEWRKGLDGAEYFNETDEKRYEAPLCAFVADALHCFSLICKQIRPSLASYYADAASALKRATFESFFDYESGGFVTRHGDEKPLHELTQALMLYTDAVPEKYVKGVEDLIMSGELIKTSVSMTVFSYEALLKNKKNADYVVDDIESVWGKMLSHGADTFWETEKGESDFSNAGSLCHGWSAVPIYIFAHYGLGK
ncbi:MAG: hypothetical protein IJD95_06075 [Clostridia bacterium]|nr:hypothetical protein [Clostridia bacterium]